MTACILCVHTVVITEGLIIQKEPQNPNWQHLWLLIEREAFINAATVLKPVRVQRHQAWAPLLPPAETVAETLLLQITERLRTQKLKMELPPGFLVSTIHVHLFLGVLSDPSAENSWSVTKTRNRSSISLLSINNAEQSENKNKHCWSPQACCYKAVLLIRTPNPLSSTRCRAQTAHADFRPEGPALPAIVQHINHPFPNWPYISG